MRSVNTLLAVFMLLALPITVKAESCPDAGIFGEKLLDSFCWDCIYPVRINGLTIRNDSEKGIPDGAMDALVCTCPDAAGVPEIGEPLSAWFPRFITETVQKPYCSPALGGTQLAEGTRIAVGGDIGDRLYPSQKAVSDSAFLHFHTLSFPILEMLEFVVEGSCNPEQFVDMELQYISEPDPLWADNLLSALLTPESMLFTNPAAMAVCSAECNAISADPNAMDFHWCAGCWGGTYPFNGHANHGGSRVKHSSLVATKALSALHRRLLAYNTVGEDAACKTIFSPSLVKKQYRMGMIYPSPEADSDHAIGLSTLLWGENRERSSAGSNHAYVGFRYQDCCLR